MREELEQQIKKALDSLPLLDINDIPSIDLYMDQVTTLMEEHLNASKRDDTDKVLTKTMINNYTKNHLLPPPDKKKYSREHVILLTFIYYFKSVLSIQDIATLLSILDTTTPDGEKELNLIAVYTEMTRLMESRQDSLVSDIENIRQLIRASELQPETPQGQEELEEFLLLSLLSFDICRKKQLIESILDSRPAPAKDKKEKEKQK